MATASNVAKCLLYLDSLESDEGSEGISNMKLQKLAYYSQGFYLAIFNEPLFDDPIAAWVHGPVVVDLYHEYKSHNGDKIPYGDDFKRSSLTKDEFGLVKEVYDVFGQYTALQLRRMTHEEPPWLNHEKTAGMIPICELKEYFKTRVTNG
jgi:uncharacterized phage-associated protein